MAGALTGVGDGVSVGVGTATGVLGVDIAMGVVDLTTTTVEEADGEVSWLILCRIRSFSVLMVVIVV